MRAPAKLEFRSRLADDAHRPFLLRINDTRRRKLENNPLKAAGRVKSLLVMRIKEECHAETWLLRRYA
jgi:hypothetical protein